MIAMRSLGSASFDIASSLETFRFLQQVKAVIVKHTVELSNLGDTELLRSYPTVQYACENTG